MNISRKGGTPPASATSTFDGDGLSRLLAGSADAPAPKLRVGPARDGKAQLRIEMPVEPLARFTLHRDEDRPLQFDGTELASVESAGGALVHRASVYRTRGGTFVSAFSSEPNIRGKVYNDPPRGPTAAVLGEFRERIIQCVIDTAEWREGRAETHPRDVRELAAAETLRRLATKLDDVSIHDTRWLVLWRADFDFSDELGDDQRTDIARRQAEQISQAIRVYGFYTDPPVVHPNLEALSFLDLLIKTLEDAARPSDVPPPSGKVAVFDSLEGALAWFRPGRLTTELITKLGRWDPEFIE